MTSPKTIVAAYQCDAYDFDKVKQTVANAVAACGGWPEKVKPGGRILLNPNLLSARPPEQVVTTHPTVVRTVIQLLHEHGIQDITLGDSPANDRPWKELWSITGMTKVCEEEGVALLPFDDVERVELPGTGTVPLLKGFRDYDAIISLPKLKTHLLTKVTAAVKNTYGMMIGAAKSNFHGENTSPRKMGVFIADFYRLVKPDFVVMDAIEAMEGDGPANGIPFPVGLIFAGSDAAAIDACACEAYDYRATDIPLLVQVQAHGLGVIDQEKIERVGDGWKRLPELHGKHSKSDLLHVIPESIFHLGTRFLQCRPTVDHSLCVKCGACERACSQNAISKKNDRFVVDNKKCILCMCCLESCPHHAIELKTFIKRLFSK